ncbi:pyridoxamine 5'-phosphate oxidase family protein [Phytoactinopolyspora halotolerans]|uniref:Pyridoxamine 5'-phosphate oxidase family protein n=2 Tax=Phytoactinopolyspora halotolerans TaxID=1981512 RepID=A0A6L9S650_9ACTN|nr:pyridoxamine 5'-phosphate oxidase family protein [Phytoactinopolyspora halotolerans]
MTVLEEDDCWQLLDTSSVARLAVLVGDDLEIFPINYVVDGRAIVFRTGEGTKLAAVTIARNVAMEIDGYHRARREAWSVVVKGTAERVEDFDEIYQTEELPLRSWSDHPKQWFVRLLPQQVTGRRFAVAGY